MFLETAFNLGNLCIIGITYLIGTYANVKMVIAIITSSTNCKLKTIGTNFVVGCWYMVVALVYCSFAFVICTVTVSETTDLCN